jgi:hypothetical protein
VRLKQALGEFTAGLIVTSSKERGAFVARLLRARDCEHEVKHYSARINNIGPNASLRFDVQERCL